MMSKLNEMNLKSTSLQKIKQLKFKLLSQRIRKITLEAAACCIFSIGVILAAYGFYTSKTSSLDELIFSSVFKILQMLILNYGWGESSSLYVHAAMFLLPISASLALFTILHGKVLRFFRTMFLYFASSGHFIVVGNCSIAVSIAIMHANIESKKKQTEKKQKVVFLGEAPTIADADNMNAAGIYVMQEEHLDAGSIVELGAHKAECIYLVRNDLTINFLELLSSKLKIYLSKKCVSPENQSIHSSTAPQQCKPTILILSEDDFVAQKIIDRLTDNCYAINWRPLNLWKQFSYQLLVHDSFSPAVLMSQCPEEKKWKIYLIGSNEKLKKQLMIQSALLLGGSECNHAKSIEFVCVAEGECKLANDVLASSPIFMMSNCQSEEQQNVKASYWLNNEIDFIPNIKFSDVEENEFYFSRQSMPVESESIGEILYVCSSSEDESFHLISKLERFIGRNNNFKIFNTITWSSNTSQSARSNTDQSANDSSAKPKEALWLNVGTIDLLSDLQEWLIPNGVTDSFYVGCSLDKGARLINLAWATASSDDFCYELLSDRFFENENVNGSIEWANLPEWNRESSRQSFIHAGIICKKYPQLKFITTEKEFRQLNDLEKILEHEHVRWATERLHLGWRYADEKNNATRTHNLIKPYSSLPDNEKNKDFACLLTGVIVFNKMYMENGGYEIYRKRPLVMNVEFATKRSEVITLEGSVQCEPGDAIVTGVKGEKWPVPQKRFNQMYIAVSPTLQGKDGQYQRNQQKVFAKRMTASFEVTLRVGSVLSGKAGDWQVQYPEGDEAIIEHEIFMATYEPVL